MREERGEMREREKKYIKRGREEKIKEIRKNRKKERSER